MAQVTITIALAAVGPSTGLRDIRGAGLRPLALGATFVASGRCAQSRVASRHRDIDVTRLKCVEDHIS